MPVARRLLSGTLLTRRRSRPRALRPTRQARGYDAPWQRTRLDVLAEEPTCRKCGAPSQHVDHIRPLRLGGSDDRANLQGLCAICHGRKTARQDGGYGNPRSLSAP